MNSPKDNNLDRSWALLFARLVLGLVALELLDQLEATHSDGALGDFFSSYAPMLPQIATTSKGLGSACIGESRRIGAGSEIVFSNRPA